MTESAPFSSLALPPPLARALEVLGFPSMTPVQAHALPPMLLGRDVIAQARTGSGKTVAFGIALLARVDVEQARTQALVLCPTRELAGQVSDEVRRLARFIPNLRVVTLCGGVPVRTQLPSLQTSPHVLVGTPGRLLDHLARRSIAIGQVRALVLDEADRMLDMGFLDAITDVARETPRERQTLLFSATFPEEIRALGRTLQRDALAVTTDAGVAAPEVEQRFFAIEHEARIPALMSLLLHHRPESALVFCHTKNDVRDVTSELAARGFSVLALHGDLEQRERDEVVVRLANKSCAVVVATDVAARGLDVKGLGAVVSYELPADTDTHIHRIGRTGRAGEMGMALTLVAPRERARVKALEAAGIRILWCDLPAAGDAAAPAPPSMTTLRIDGGKPDKLRPGDLLGALTGDVSLTGDMVGKIDIGVRQSFVAVRADVANRALVGLRAHGIKGRTFRVWKIP